MINSRNVVALTIALAALGASTAPTYARDAARAADAVYGADADQMEPARIRALEECTKMEQRYPQGAWGSTQILGYRGCMAEHHQPE
jgi:hypothetical protein